MSTASTTEPKPAANASLSASIDLERLYEINGRCIAALVAFAKRPIHRRPVDSLATQVRDLLISLDSGAHRRAAECRFSLVDVAFSDDEWWRSVRPRPLRPSSGGVRPDCFPRRTAVSLGHSALALAWHIASIDVGAARLFFGLSSGCAGVISSLTLEDLESIAHRHFHYVRPRWETRPALWRTLLTAARAGEAKALKSFHLHAIQMLLGNAIEIGQ